MDAETGFIHSLHAKLGYAVIISSVFCNQLLCGAYILM